MPLRWSVYSQISTEKRILYGQIVLSIDDINRNLEHRHILRSESGKENGVIWFEDFKMIEKPSFVEYLKSGWLINLAVGIDFTASNAAKHQLSNDPNVLNDYEVAIREVGKVLQPYAVKN
jgi:hypothetical protein